MEKKDLNNTDKNNFNSIDNSTQKYSYVHLNDDSINASFSQNMELNTNLHRSDFSANDNDSNDNDSNEDDSNEYNSNEDDLNYDDSNDDDSNDDDIDNIINSLEPFEKEIDVNAKCYAEFSDGYSFRNLIEYLRLTNLTGTFRFYTDKIVYEKSNKDHTILNQFIIYPHELTDYNLDSKTGEIITTVTLSNFRNVTKNIGKKDRAILYKSPNDSRLYIRILNSNSQSGSEPSGLFPVDTEDIEYYEYAHPTFTRKENEPNCTVNQTDFAKMCSSMLAVKSRYVTAHGMRNGIIFKGISSTGKVVYVKDFGKVREEQEKIYNKNITILNSCINSINSFRNNRKIIKSSNVPAPKLRIGEYAEIDRFTMSMPTIRGLAKLNNLSPMGNIKIYIERGKPLRFICSIGGYGKLTVHVRSCNGYN